MFVKNALITERLLDLKKKPIWRNPWLVFVFTHRRVRNHCLKDLIQLMIVSCFHLAYCIAIAAFALFFLMLLL